MLRHELTARFARVAENAETKYFLFAAERAANENMQSLRDVGYASHDMVCT